MQDEANNTEGEGEITLSKTTTKSLNSLAEVLTRTARGEINIEQARKSISHNSEILSIIQKLAGHQIRTTDATLLFGEGANIGDVTVRDLAGRDIINISVINIPNQPTSLEEINNDSQRNDTKKSIKQTRNKDTGSGRQDFAHYALGKGFATTIVAVIAGTTTFIGALIPALIGNPWLNGNQLIIIFGILAFSVVIYFAMTYNYLTKSTTQSKQQKETLANELGLGHDFQNGKCQKCGCSLDAALHFKWECND